MDERSQHFYFILEMQKEFPSCLALIIFLTPDSDLFCLTAVLGLKEIRLMLLSCYHRLHELEEALQSSF